VTDSAAGVTALVTGHRTVIGALSAAPRPDRSVDSLATLLESAEARGWATGIVTTTRVTHATPAGCYAHTLYRGDELAIAAALVPGSGNPRLGDGIEVVLGGGRSWFEPKPAGHRDDGRSLLTEMEAAAYRVMEDAASLQAATRDTASRVLGLFAPDHLAYEVDRVRQSRPEPSLADMVEAALAVLRRNPKGFFLMVEGGRIDHALHDGNGYRAVNDMLAMDEALEVALRLDPDRTVVFVTADHDHVMVLAGYPPRGADVFSQAGVDANGKPYTAILFANGPGASLPVPDVLDESRFADPDFRERAGVPLGSETHGGMDVPLYAFGPARYRDRVRASMENTEVHAILLDAIEGR
jgi:alkaline phosphatase